MAPEKAEPVVRANIEVPDRKMEITWRLRRGGTPGAQAFAAWNE
jgi:hypothetical protein